MGRSVESVCVCVRLCECVHSAIVCVVMTVLTDASVRKAFWKGKAISVGGVRCVKARGSAAMQASISCCATHLEDDPWQKVGEEDVLVKRRKLFGEGREWESEARLEAEARDELPSIDLRSSASVPLSTAPKITPGVATVTRRM